MRLIDADDAINIFTNRLFEMLKTHIPVVTAEENQVCLNTCYKIAKYEIDNIPTAYDVEKVVEEIEIDRQVDFNYHIRTDYRLLINDIYDKTVQKVKKGGVE